MDNIRQEKLKSSVRQESAKAPEKKKSPESKEIKNKAKEILQTAESAESQEGVELGEGKISETAGEDKVYAPMSGVKAYTADQIEAIRAKLLAAVPPQEVMIKQIKRKLIKQEKALQKKKKNLQKKADRRAFELTIVVAQLRKIREYFSMLVHATYEMVKHLWLKIVHGI